MSRTSPGHSKRVLLVDDDYRTSQRLAEQLQGDGFDVEVARDGATAIARLARAPLFDTLVTELALPLCDGTVVARFGRSQHAGLAVVVVTREPGLFVPAAVSDPPPVLLTKPLEYPLLLEALCPA